MFARLQDESPAARSAEASVVCCLKLMLRGSALLRLALAGGGRAGNVGRHLACLLVFDCICNLSRSWQAAEAFGVRIPGRCVTSVFVSGLTGRLYQAEPVPVLFQRRSKKLKDRWEAQRCQWFEHCRERGAESRRKVDRAFKKSIDRSNDLGAAHQRSCTVDQMI